METKTFNSTDTREIHFSNVNYTVFGITLALSALIGIYFGFFAKKKQNTTVEYLLGGKQMSFFPIAASLVASHISGEIFKIEICTRFEFCVLNF